MKKVFAVICCIVLAACMFGCVDHREDPVLSTEAAVDLAHEYEMNAQLNDLILYFTENGYSTSEQRYPDFYAGAYIPEDRSELIVCVTDDSEEIQHIIQAGTQNPNITVQKVTHSYTALKQEAAAILENYADSAAALNSAAIMSGTTPLEIIGTGVSVQNNSVVITIKNYDAMITASAGETLAIENAIANLIASVSPADAGEFKYIIESGSGILEK
ncbi:MAG: hypothetical protein IJX64_01795 [Clostridia bacterium]|nr:hypothetical protein [Clostridia bacterium]